MQWLHYKRNDLFWDVILYKKKMEKTQKGTPEELREYTEHVISSLIKEHNVEKIMRFSSMDELFRK